jgi:LDH2 family malate/lactate/ureidoglycolate dehydrogenase
MPAQQPGKGIGHFFGAMRVDAFRPEVAYRAAMDHWIRGFRNARPATGYEKVLIPGDPEREAAALRIREGIPFPQSVIDDLKALAEKFNIPSMD